MIINISGPSCTGKTTLVTNLSKRRKDIKNILKVNNVVPVYETARDIFKTHFGEKYETLNDLLQSRQATLDYHWMIAQDQAKRIGTYADDPNRLYIMDRGPLDTSIYLMLNYSYNLDPLDGTRRQYETTIKLLKSLHVKSKAITFRTLPFDIEVEKDGFRPEKYEELRDMEVEMFENVFQGAPVLPDGAEKRVEFILDYLKEGRF